MKLKTNKILFLLFIALAVTGCKKEQNKPEEVKKTEVVTFTLNAIVKADDDFQIFYKEDNGPESTFSEESSVWVGVKGSETAQDIVFAMPEGVFPTQLRLDLGQKPQTEIVVNNFTAKYMSKSFETKGPLFFEFFTPDENFVKFDKAALKVLPIIKDGKTDPMVYSHSSLDLELAKFVQ